MIDIKQILDDHSIDYITKGTGVSKGNINVKCPFCGKDDRSQHLGIKLSNGFWGCWRDSNHRGTNLSYLLIHLLGINKKEVDLLLKDGSFSDHLNSSLTINNLSLGNFFEEIKANDFAVDSLTKSLILPKYFKSFREDHFSKNRFIKYLTDTRGFNNKDILDVTDLYNLRYCLLGDFSYRIIIPIYYQNVLVTWTSRAMGNSSLRYLTLSKEKSSLSIKDCIFNYDNCLAGGKVLFICEGPFDAMKLDFYGRKFDCRSSALFNLNLERSQLYKLVDLMGYYEKVVILLDKGAYSKSEKIYNEISIFHKSVINYDFKILADKFDIKDPAEMNKKIIGNFCLEFV